MDSHLTDAFAKPFPIFSLLCVAIIAVLYIQSGADKVMDREGNLGWLRQHFGRSIFKNLVPPMFYTVTLLELASAIACIAGMVEIFVYKRSHNWAFYGGVLSAINLICLFTGQRFAKDYAGAAALVPYFILSILAMFVCRMGI
jgi:hypothetical protein